MGPVLTIKYSKRYSLTYDCRSQEKTKKWKCSIWNENVRKCGLENVKKNICSSNRLVRISPLFCPQFKKLHANNPISVVGVFSSTTTKKLFGSNTNTPVHQILRVHCNRANNSACLRIRNLNVRAKFYRNRTATGRTRIEQSNMHQKHIPMFETVTTTHAHVPSKTMKRTK